MLELLSCACLLAFSWFPRECTLLFCRTGSVTRALSPLRVGNNIALSSTLTWAMQAGGKRRVPKLFDNAKKCWTILPSCLTNRSRFCHRCFQCTQGFTPLHVAARCGRLAVLRALLDAGVPVDCSSSPAGTTPLHLSAGFSRESCVMELLHRGADSAKENKRGATPLDMVGTLIPPCMDDPRASGRVKSAFENKLAQGMCVRIALEKAQAWQRRRMAVLLCEILRRRALENKTVAERDVSCAGEMHSGGRGGKRYKLSAGLAGTMEDVSHGGANDRRREEQGCVIVRLCAHPDAHLTRNVIRFL